MTVSICLTPARDQRGALDAVIASYAVKHGRSPFRAHLTLVTAIEMPAISEAEIASLASAHAALTLARTEVLRTAAFGRCFALAFAATPALLALRADACALVNGPMDEEAFLPHVSLTYEPPPAFEALEAAAACFAGPVRFDGLETLTHNCVSTSQSDIAAWRYSATHALAD